LKNNNQYQYFLPFYKYRVEDKKKYLQIFPFYKTIKSDKEFSFYFLGLDLFLKDTVLEKNYARFWRIIDYNRQNNNFDLKLFYSLINIYKTNENAGISFFPVFSVNKNINEKKYKFNLLFEILNFSL
jgi:hypothetical protein